MGTTQHGSTDRQPDLAERVGRVKPGDTVTARFRDGDGADYTVSGTARTGDFEISLSIGYQYLRTRTGQPDIALLAIESHEPAVTTAPHQQDVDAVRDLLDLMQDFSSNDQRARYLLSSNWLRDRGIEAAERLQGVGPVIESHEPAKPPVPPEPTGDSIVKDAVGVGWHKVKDGLWSTRSADVTGSSWQWVAVDRGPVTVYRPEPSAQHEAETVSEFAEVMAADAADWDEATCRAMVREFLANLGGAS